MSILRASGVPGAQQALARSALLALVLLATAAAANTTTSAAGGRASSNVSSTKCPPLGFNSVANLNLSAYISAPWYVQQQLPVSFQGEDPLSDLYCVRARWAAQGHACSYAPWSLA